MDLPVNTIKGLITIQDREILPEEAFSEILDSVISHICKNTELKHIVEIQGGKPELIKAAFADIASLYVEAARQDLDKEELDIFLQRENIRGPREERLCDTYINNKKEIQAQLELIGNSLPHVVDINWRLDYCIKSNTENSIGLPLYHVQLHTIKHGELKNLTFSCTVQQLQELVYKLKDAARHIEKLVVT